MPDFVFAMNDVPEHGEGEGAVLRPRWPAPPQVRALVTTRAGGVSVPPFAAMNLGEALGDDAAAVAENRRRVQDLTGLPRPVQYLRQEHGVTAVSVENFRAVPPRGDILHTRVRGQPCAVLGADCLPVLLCDRAGTLIAAAHAGWRGLGAGVLEAAVAVLPAPPTELLAWLGPAISGPCYEVDKKVRDTFPDIEDSTALGEDACFTPVAPDHWHMDLVAVARRRLRALGVSAIYGGHFCTFSDARFFSCRRDGLTGRMAALIWLQ